MVGPLPSIGEILRKLGTVPHTQNPSTWDMKAGIKCHLSLHGEFQLGILKILAERGGSRQK